MNVDKHISQLLYEHDCVIVPELGGFVGNYAPAKIHPTQHTFSPPSKKIIFNKSLHNNDGLLANQIVHVEKINYPQALQRISLFVENTNSRLKKGERVKIEEVGTLYWDVERNIQFEPETINFLLDAFGLDQFQSPAIRRDNIGRRIEKEFKDRTAVPALKKKINIKRYVALAIAIPVVFAIVWIPLKTDLLKRVNYANFNPFSSKEIVKTETKKVPEKTIALPLTKIKNDTALVKPAIKAPVQPVTATLVEPVKADTTAVVRKNDVSKDFKFHLVAGCFQIEENAVKFVSSLQGKNIPASIIGKNKNGLFIVSCGDYANYKQATEELGSLRKLQPEAWLYKN